MVEFSERMFYKTRFNVELVDETEDLLWKIVVHIKNWMTAKYNKGGKKQIPVLNSRWTAFKFGTGKIFSSDYPATVYMESDLYQDDIKMCWACKIVERGQLKEDYAARNWTTQIGIEMVQGQPALFSCIISYNDSVDFIGPSQDKPIPSIPKIIRSMMEDETIKCSFGSDLVTYKPIKIQSGMEESLWQKLIDKNRVFPYLLLCPCPTRDENDEMRMETIVNPFHLAKYLCGNAIIYYIDSYSVLEEINMVFGPGYKCHLGTMCVFKPGIDMEESNAFNMYRQFSKPYIDSIGEKDFLLILRRVFAQDLHYTEDKDYIIIDYCRKLHRQQDTQRRIDETRQNLVSEFKTELNDREETLIREWMEEAQKCEDLQRENDELKAANHKLNARIDSMKGPAAKGRQVEYALEARNKISEYPIEKEAVLDYFSKVYKDRIVFTDDAIRSLKDCTLSNSDIWKAFYCLSTHMFDIFKNGAAQPYDQFKSITGIECAAGEGGQTHKDSRIMRQYQIEFNGEDVNIEPHLKYNREGYQRIHFGKLNDGRILVGHCGEHLDTAGTHRR